MKKYKNIEDMINENEESSFEKIEFIVPVKSILKAKIIEDKEWTEPINENSKLLKYNKVSFTVDKIETPEEQIDEPHTLIFLHKVVYKNNPDRIADSVIWKTFLKAYKSGWKNVEMTGMRNIEDNEIRIDKVIYQKYYDPNRDI